MPGADTGCANIFAFELEETGSGDVPEGDSVGAVTTAVALPVLGGTTISSTGEQSASGGSGNSSKRCTLALRRYQIRSVTSVASRSTYYRSSGPAVRPCDAKRRRQGPSSAKADSSRLAESLVECVCRTEAKVVLRCDGVGARVPPASEAVQAGDASGEGHIGTLGRFKTWNVRKVKFALRLLQDVEISARGGRLARQGDVPSFEVRPLSSLRPTIVVKHAILASSPSAARSSARSAQTTEVEISQSALDGQR